MEDREDGEEKEWGGEGEVCGGSEGDSGDCASLLVQNEQECGGGGDCAWDRPGGLVVEQG
jgi:hypothetical protein